MLIQFKMNETTGEICDVKIVRAPRDMRTYNRNYYEAKTKKVLQCEHCKALLCSQQNLTRHQEKVKEVPTDQEPDSVSNGYLLIFL